MCPHCLNDSRICSKFLKNTYSNFDMSTCNFMVNCFSDIVKKSASFCNIYVCSKLFRNHSCNMRHFS